MMEKTGQIKRKSILVVGDVMLDAYYRGEVNRISPEAPVPIFHKLSTNYVPGGAANVAVNLSAAQQDVSLMSVIGDEEAGKILRKILIEQGVNTELIVASKKRKTTVKTRCLGENNQQILRLDTEEIKELSSVECEKMLATLKKQITKFNLIILSDYLKGLLSYEFTQGIIKLAKENKISVFVDVKGAHAEKYEGADLLKPNMKELSELTSKELSTEDTIIEAAQILREKTKCKYVLTTCGAKGMVLVGDETPYYVNAFAKEVYDVTGAGDTTIAYLSACVINGYKMQDAVEIANFAAGIQVGKVGTSPVYLWEVQENFIQEAKEIPSKMLSDDQIEKFRQTHLDKKIVFTNGCFDILHTGHIKYLRDAARKGDILIVGLNSDSSVKKLKGNDRPINTESDRAEMLCALEFVNYVAIFDEETPLELIKRIKPDILVKGGDYKGKLVVGAKEIEEYGGKVILIPFVKGKSTTNIISKIRKHQ